MLRFFTWLGLIFTWTGVWAQCPVVNITLPDSVCTNERFSFDAQSVTARVIWDFCSGDLEQTPTAKSVGSLGSGGITIGMDIAYDGGNYFALITSRGTNELFRVSFGPTLTNVAPVVNKVNIPANSLNGPEGIKLYKEGSNWYALICNITDSSITRYSFGSSLTNAPTADILTLPDGLLSNPRKIEVVQDKNSVIALVTNFNNNLSIFNFGSSIVNDLLDAGNISIPNVSGLQGIAVTKECDRWYALCTGYFSASVHKVDFGSSITATPASIDLVATISGVSPISIKIAKDGNKTFAFIGTYEGSLPKLDFGQSLIDNGVIISNQGSFGLLSSVGDLAFNQQTNSQWIGIGVNYDTQALYQFVFPNNCSANIPVSAELSLTNVQYSQPGNYYVTVTTEAVNGDIASIVDTITVTGLSKPDFTVKKLCIEEPTQFSGLNSSAADIAAWEWDFGDGEVAIGQNAEHVYKRTGTYAVTLTVRDAKACANAITSNVKISSPLLPNFSSALLLCPTNTIQYTDVSIGSSGEAAQQWRWNFGDGNISNQKNPQHTYLSAGTYNVSLQVSLTDGCASTVEKKVTINPRTPSNLINSPNACTNQSLAITSGIEGATKYEWDFCTGDLSSVPSIENVQDIEGSNLTLGITTAFDGANYYSFVTSRGTNELYRLDFGNKLTNRAVITKLPISNNQLNQPEGIKFVQQGTNWYAIICNVGNSTLTKYRFGHSLTNIPTASDITQLNVAGNLLSSPRNLEIVSDHDNLRIVVANQGSNQISVLYIGNLEDNGPVTGANFTIPNASGLYDVTLAKDCNQWYGLCSGNSSNTLHKINFGETISATPKTITTLGNVTEPLTIGVARDGGAVYAFVGAGQGGVSRIDFGKSLSNTNFRLTNANSSFVFNNLAGLDLVKQADSRWLGIGTNYLSHTLQRIEFTNDCSASIATSLENVPNNVYYSKPGNYFIEATISDANGNTSVIADSIIVTNAIAPSIDFTTDDQCTETATQFLGTSNDISNVNFWTWDFGDGTAVESGQQVRHHYDKEGTYEVVLTVSTANSCDNRVIKSVVIYNNHKPTPGFAVNPLVCSNAVTQFTDLSEPYQGESIKYWHWNFGDGDTSLVQHPSHVFKRAGTYVVTLAVAGVSGCDSIISQTITVSPGASVDFRAENVCQGEIASFVNVTLEDGQWAWDFGDVSATDNTSSEKNPSHRYPAPGLYTVTLTATTANGCIVSRLKQIRIGIAPTLDFVYPKACVGTPVEFNVATLVSDTTTAAVNWSFGDPGSSSNTSSEETPVHVFSKPGMYNVTLTVVTALGCQGVVAKVVEITMGTLADFRFTSACATQPITFTDTSVPINGKPIEQWRWRFGDGSPIVSVRNPVHTYAKPGIYTVTLTTGSSQSDCQSASSKQVRVEALPQIDFGARVNCKNYSVSFTDKSTVAGGTMTTWEWNFAGEGVSDAQNPVFDFKRAGQFAITLKGTAENGCTTTAVHTIEIPEPAKADFRFYLDSQTTPVVTQFINDSNQAINYQWIFGDNSNESTEASPRHVYSKTGTYPVTLIATNSAGCADTVVKVVNVGVSSVDIQMRNVQAYSRGNQYLIQAEVFNASVTTVGALTFALQSGTQLNVQEEWAGEIKPRQSIIYLFKTQLESRFAEQLRYLCINAFPPEEINEVTLADNRSCIALQNDFSILNVYPNPIHREGTVTCILPANHPVILEVFDAQGKNIIRFVEDYTQEGINELPLNMTMLPYGIYEIRLTYQGQVRSRRVLRVED